MQSIAEDYPFLGLRYVISETVPDDYNTFFYEFQGVFRIFLEKCLRFFRFYTMIFCVSVPNPL